LSNGALKILRKLLNIMNLYKPGITHAQATVFMQFA